MKKLNIVAAKQMEVGRVYKQQAKTEGIPPLYFYAEARDKKDNAMLGVLIDCILRKIYDQKILAKFEWQWSPENPLTVKELMNELEVDKPLREKVKGKLPANLT